MTLRRWRTLLQITPVSGLMAVGNRSHTSMLNFREQGYSHIFLLLVSRITVNGVMLRILKGQFEGSSGIFASIPGPLQMVQRAEYWEVILALHWVWNLSLSVASYRMCTE